MISFERLKKRYSKASKAKKYATYSDLDELPIWNWNKVRETSDLRYLIKSSNPLTHPKKSIIELEPRWMSLFQEYLDNFGMNRKQKQLLSDKKRAVLLRLKAAITGDRIYDTLAELKENELANSSGTIKTTNFMDTIAILDESLRTLIDPKKMSTNSFFSHIKRLNNKAELSHVR